MSPVSDSALTAALKQDRLIVVFSLAILTALAWIYLFWIRAHMEMPAPAMAGMTAMPGMASMTPPQPLVWSIGHTSFVFAMWAVMMIGMMTPSAAPMILIYAQIARRSHEPETPFASSAWFAGGYLTAWSLFSLVATICQYLLERAIALSPMMTLTNRYSTGVLLLAAGIYQWTPVKSACLAHCRAPLSFVQRHGGFQASALGSVKLGLLHGVYCIGCCWIIMALLFVGGVMNVLWIAALSAAVLLEKLIPRGRHFSTGLGIVAIVAGVWTLWT